ncbi:DUF4832 domain-containing protein [Pararcticibacter amylolyticus]|nr:DUF4832 domain-containing protein [Pararcticibacter amylolyticus]
MRRKSEKLIYLLLLLPVGLVFFFMSCGKKKAEGAPDTSAEINYSPSLDIFPNPERGFIHTYIVKSGGTPLSSAQLGLLRKENISMVLRVFYLDSFKDKPIDEAGLSLIQADLQKIRDAGLKAILRFAYTDEITGTDAPYDIIEQHLNQLKPIFEQNKDVISFVQAGFIGAWGEWHSSSNGLATTDNERKVLFKLLEVLPSEIMVQVRTPGQKQAIFNTASPVDQSIAYSADKKARVGHHNDCFMSGGSNYGTYSNVTAEKTYISNDALYIPTGGETCPPEGGYDPSCPEGRNEMKLLKWTYLNLDYYQPTLNAWKSSGCFDEFHRNLGYRLVLLKSKLLGQAVAGQDYSVSISMTNTGYAPLYNYKVTSLVLKNTATQNVYSFELPVDIRQCKPSGTFNIDQPVKLAGVSAGNYDLYLKIADKADNLKNRAEYCVRLANTGVWTEDGGMNKLMQQIKVSAQ